MIAPVAERAPVVLREGKAEDRAYIIGTWAASLQAMIGEPFRDGSPERGRLHSALLRRAEKRLDGGTAVVAAFDEEPKYILGWVVMGRDRRVRFVYVRRDYQGGGIARMLVGAAGVDP